MRRGRGFAIAHQGRDLARPLRLRSLNVAADGSVTLYCGTVDMGQGSDTAMAQMVGELLNIPAETVRVVQRDTDVTPYDMGTLGSRSLFHMGHAVRLAAEEVRGKLAALAREVGEPEGSNISDRRPVQEAIRHAGRQHHRQRHLQAGLSCRRAPGTGLKPEHHAVLDGGRRRRRGRGRYRDRPRADRTGWSMSSTAASRSIRASCETQISGAALMQLGFTMFEKMHLDGGQVTNASLADYKIPGILDVRRVMVNEAIDAYQHNGPFGAKGVGESATFCLSPAIANAIDDAVGVRLTELPLTPEAVFRALRAKMGNPLP